VSGTHAAVGAASPEPLKPDDLPLDGKQTFAWPMGTVRSGSRLNKVLVLRLDPEVADDFGSVSVVGYGRNCYRYCVHMVGWFVLVS
jgi:hypothetical protein